MTILTLTILTTIYFKPRITRILRISECRRKFAFSMLSVSKIDSKNQFHEFLDAHTSSCFDKLIRLIREIRGC